MRVRCNGRSSLRTLRAYEINASHDVTSSQPLRGGICGVGSSTCHSRVFKIIKCGLRSVMVLGVTSWMSLSFGSTVATAATKHASPGGSLISAAGVVVGGQTLAQVWPVGASTLWAFTDSAAAAPAGMQALELTTDGGKRWTNVAPSDCLINGGFALSPTRAWLTAVTLRRPPLKQQQMVDDTGLTRGRFPSLGATARCSSLRLRWGGAL